MVAWDRVRQQSKPLSRWEEIRQQGSHPSKPSKEDDSNPFDVQDYVEPVDSPKVVESRYRVEQKPAAGKRNKYGDSIE
jgi:hypothetical protein